MKHSLAEIFSIINDAGVRDLGGFPLRATLAAIALGEGADPNAWVEHDPPTSSTAPPSSGLYQVNRRAWPQIYENTERVRLAALSDRDKMLAMTVLVKPIAVHMLEGALEASDILAERGFKATRLQQALFMDAAWQAGAGGLAAWARRTRTGDPREIVNAPRTIAAEVSLRKLAGEALGLASGEGILIGLLVAAGLFAVVMSQVE